jgi:hypothetical protein
MRSHVTRTAHCNVPHSAASQPCFIHIRQMCLFFLRFSCSYDLPFAGGLNVAVVIARIGVCYDDVLNSEEKFGRETSESDTVVFFQRTRGIAKNL